MAILRSRNSTAKKWSHFAINTLHVTASTMVFSNDVDICVTCVTDRLPKLPLREELVSLGVEVVYKAAGGGVEAVRHVVKRQVREYGEQIQKMNSGPKHSPGTSQTPEQKIQQRVKQQMVANG